MRQENATKNASLEAHRRACSSGVSPAKSANAEQTNDDYKANLIEEGVEMLKNR